MINSVVDQNQSAVVPGRVIHDNIFMAKELIMGYNKKYISPRCMIQMDIQKTYDSIDWGALEGILMEMGFPKVFVDWVMIGVTTVSYKYNIFGQQTNIL